MFTGESSHALDAKNRVFVPKRFQDELQRDGAGVLSVVLTRGFDGCLFLFSKEEFRAAAARLRLAPFEGQKARNFQRLFFANTHETTLDGSGRIVLPEKLRGLAGLSKEVVMVGVGERAEIWDAEAWRRFESEHNDHYDDLDQVLTGDGAVPGGPGA